MPDNLHGCGRACTEPSVVVTTSATRVLCYTISIPHLTHGMPMSCFDTVVPYLTYRIQYILDIFKSVLSAFITTLLVAVIWTSVIRVSNQKREVLW